MQKKNLMMILPAVMALGLVAGPLSACGKKQNQSQSEVATLTVSPKNGKVYLNDESATIQLTATLTNSSQSLVWSSSNAAVATVSETGLVTGHSLGSATITVKTQDESLSTTATITVKQDRSQDDTINDLNKPSFLTNYERRTASLDKVANIQDNADPSRTSYYENEAGTRDFYKVGNQNPFKAQITGVAVDERGREEEIANPFTTIKVEKYDAAATTSDKYVAIPDAQLVDHVAINPSHNSYQFTEAAAGNRYRITVSIDESKYSDVSEYCSDVVMEVEVFNGYNVYTKEELSVYDNFQEAWAELKAANGLTDVQAKGIALHANLEIRNEDIPSAFKYSEEAVNTYISNYSTDFNNWVAQKKANRPTQEEKDSFDANTAKALLVDSVKDWATIYNRRTAETDDFKFEGNYFTLDFTNVKQIQAFDENMANGHVATRYVPDDPLVGCNGSHGQLFGINTEVNEEHYGGDYTIRNMTILGNGDRSSDDNYMGGLITFKVKSIDFTCQNVLTSKTFITFMAETPDYSVPVTGIETTTVLDRCKNFDSYNSLMYYWGVEKNIITNSFMVGAGGSIALLDDVNANEAARTDVIHGTPQVDCFNCYFSNPVTGVEPWFQMHKASELVQQMQAFGLDLAWLGRNANAHGTQMNISTKDAQNNPYLDLIAIDICGASPLANKVAEGGAPLQGHFNIYNDAAFTNLVAGLQMNKMGAVSPVLAATNPTEFATQVGAQYAQGNVLPLYRAIALSQGAQGVVVESSAGGHAMLGSANGANGLVGYINGTEMSALPFYDYPDLVPGGDGTHEVAFNNGFADNMNKLASGDYLSVYLMPQADAEYLGAFIKMHKIGA